MAAQAELALGKLEKRWLQYHLVIIDELGYIPFSKQAAELLFQFLSLRHERGSLLITTNLDFDRWTEVFGDAQPTTALLDRLTHRAVIIVTNGESYRVRESMRAKEAEAKANLATELGPLACSVPCTDLCFWGGTLSRHHGGTLSGCHLHHASSHSRIMTPAPAAERVVSYEER